MSRMTLEQYILLVRREWIHSNSLWTHHRELWAENGDALSRIYAGTGALNTSFTRSGKRTLAGVLSDATKSVSRAYINNFQDKGKQTAIDMFLVSGPRNEDVLDTDIFEGQHEQPAIRDDIRSDSRLSPSRIRESVSKTYKFPFLLIFLGRLQEYASTKQSTLFVGTWNLNGRVSCFVLGFLELCAHRSMFSLPQNPCCLGCSLERVRSGPEKKLTLC
jgi:hypothetical protein